VRNLVISLGDEGILRVVENPFEIRAEIADYARLEDLPRTVDTPSIKDELDEFVKRKREAVEETQRMLRLGEIEKRKKEKLSKLEDEMKKMKGKRPPPLE